MHSVVMRPGLFRCKLVEVGRIERRKQVHDVQEDVVPFGLVQRLRWFLSGRMQRLFGFAPLSDGAPSDGLFDGFQRFCAVDPVFREQDGLTGGVELCGIAHELSLGAPKRLRHFLERDSQEDVEIARHGVFHREIVMTRCGFDALADRFDFRWGQHFVDVDAEAVCIRAEVDTEVIVTKRFR